MRRFSVFFAIATAMFVTVVFGGTSAPSAREDFNAHQSSLIQITHRSSPMSHAVQLAQACQCTAQEQKNCRATGRNCVARVSGGRCHKACA
jgi:hypothetical protein